MFADIFGAYTLGLAYAYAALMLRLHPHHDEPSRKDEARDVDRARLILATLETGGEAGTEFRTQVSRLDAIWTDAVIMLAGPGQASKAAAAAAGLPAEDNWLDDYMRAVIGVLDNRGSVKRFDATLWATLKFEWAALANEGADRPKENVPRRKMLESTEDVLAVLNFAWAERITSQPEDLKDITLLVERLWNERKRAGR